MATVQYFCSNFALLAVGLEMTFSLKAVVMVSSQEIHLKVSSNYNYVLQLQNTHTHTHK